MAEVELSVILAAHMEEENLRFLLPRVKDVVAKLGLAAEVLVIDSLDPKDKTECVCREMGIGYARREGGSDYGYAVVTGIKKARGKHLIFMDADGSHSPEFIEELYRSRDSYDVVIASRYVEGGATQNSAPLILMSKTVNVLYSVILNLKCKDVSNSFKLYKTDDLRRLDLRCKHFDIVEEILFKLKKGNPVLRILEIPFTFKERVKGRTKRNLVAFVFSYFVTILRLRFGR